MKRVIPFIIVFISIIFYTQCNDYKSTDCTWCQERNSEVKKEYCGSAEDVKLFESELMLQTDSVLIPYTADSADTIVNFKVYNDTGTFIRTDRYARYNIDTIITSGDTTITWDSSWYQYNYKLNRELDSVFYRKVKQDWTCDPNTPLY